MYIWARGGFCGKPCDRSMPAEVISQEWTSARAIRAPA
jgi:hypothetical protein